MNTGILENRRSCRYVAVQSMIHLGWWEEPEFRTISARLTNLSHGGALVSAPLPPPEGDGVELWLSMSGATASTGDWAAVSVVSIAPERDGYYHIRLRFTESCPYEIFNLAVHGISVGN